MSNTSFLSTADDLELASRYAEEGSEGTPLSACLTRGSCDSQHLEPPGYSVLSPAASAAPCAVVFDRPGYSDALDYVDTFVSLLTGAPSVESKLLLGAGDNIEHHFGSQDFMLKQISFALRCSSHPLAESSDSPELHDSV